MQTKTEIIQEFNAARAKTRALLPEIDGKMQIYPNWTIKEVLSHLIGWDDANIMALEAFATGQPPVAPALRGVDFYNAQIIEEREALSYEQIVSEWEWAREQLITVLDKLTETDLQSNIVAPWGISMSVLELLTRMAAHEKEHAETIQRLIGHSQEPPHTH